jgi:D-alanine-D-alanine ligase
MSAAESATESLQVAILAGGRSSEHEVSLSSAASIGEGLLARGHSVIWIEIGRDGIWRRDGVQLSVTPGVGLLGVDVVFPALHGPFGEDGTVQGLLEALDVPYVGAGVAASAVCLDKVLFKELMSAVGIEQVDYVGVHPDGIAQALEQLPRLGLPVFVKPARLGSSVGIVRVEDPAELEGALRQAFTHDSRVIVEAMAHGVEVECGVLGLLEDEREDGASLALASEPGEIVLPGEWYDYEAKYTPAGMELRVPASISASARERVRQLALETFQASGCEGLARVDFFVEGEQVVVNELNTMPGFTPTSVYAKLFDASGIPYPQLVERLCLLALERHRARSAYSW